MKKSSIQQIKNILDEHSVSDGQIIMVGMDLNHEGLPRTEMMFAKASAMEILGMVRILRTHLDKIEKDIFEKIDEKRNGIREHSIQTPEEKPDADLSRAKTSSLGDILKNIKDMF
jgi:hypothetical protein